MKSGIWRRRIWRLCVVLLAAGAAGCASKARAQTVPDGPPLSMPAPPPRVIAPPEEPEVVAAAPVVDPPPATSTTPAPPRPQARPQTPAAAQQTPAPVTPAVEAPRVARPTAADVAEEKRIQTILARARRDIGRLVYQRLSPDGRAQYDQSRSLAEQADQAIKDRNWVFAQTLADKAATLAAELVAR
jgi:hypothetical protein